MKAFRSFLMIISFSIFGIGCLIVGFLVLPIVNFFIKKKSKRLNTYSNIIHLSWKFFVNFLQLIGVLKFNIENIDSFKNVKNSIIVATHPSYIDVLILLALIPKTTCFVAPRLTKNAFFKKIVESMFLISGKPLEELLTDTDYMLKEGFNVLIFPSGIRHRKNEHPKIKKGAALIAMSSKKDIIPVVMYTDFDFLQIGQPFYDAGEKTVTYSIKCNDKIKVEHFLINHDEVEVRKTLTEAIRNSLYE